jgi:hypothetical protein
MPLLGAGQIRELARSFDIGGHTVNHLLLDAVSLSQGSREIVESKLWLQDITGMPCHMFCPPGGRYRRGNLAQIREAGYRGIRTVELMSMATPASRGGLVFLPTTLQLYRHRPLTYLKNAAKRGRWKNFQNYITLAHGSDLVQTADSILEKLLASGGMLHIWGHSWELEHSRLWGTLEAILKSLHRNREHCRFVSNSELCQAVEPVHPASAAWGGPEISSVTQSATAENPAEENLRAVR